ncbi:MAG: DEAD/DEAH box helicase, partial [Emcibacteraceae bacterium]|nr:DEAD/DEAH box helicase [Emcibacteraceae bacterium]
GKTTMTLVLWEVLRTKKLVDKLLVVAPRSAFEAWEQDSNDIFFVDYDITIFTNAGIDQSNDIILVNYEQLQDQNKVNRLSRWVEMNDAMLVIDEAHRIKAGPNSIRWLGVREISLKAKRVDLLTGTPMPQGFDDVRNLYSISWPDIPRQNISDSLLSSARRGGVYVRTTKDELDLPEVQIKEIPIPMGEIQSNVYSALKRIYTGSFALDNRAEDFMSRKGRAVMTLMAVATNPGLLSEATTEDSFLNLEWPLRGFEDDASLLSLVSNYAIHELPPKYEWVIDHVEKAAHEKRKILIWSNFIGNLRALEKYLKPYNPALVFGGTKKDVRKDEIKRFRENPDCHVLLTNPQTLGEGISLHKKCHEAIYIDRTYNAALYLQSLDRIHRLGLSKDQETKIFILQSERSIDERISGRLEEKISRMSRFLSDPGLIETTIPLDLDETSPSELIGLDNYDLNELLAHLRIDE